MFKSLIQHFFFTFTRISQLILVALQNMRKILQQDGKVIHFVSHKWITPSIKDCERQRRNATDISYHIVGAAQKQPKNWLTALHSFSFKTSLVEFLVPAWSNSHNSSILDKVVRTEERSLFCTHEEADSHIFFHISSLENQSNVVIRTADTDCLIIGLGCHEKLDPSLKIWLGCRVEITYNLLVLIL